MTLRLQQYFWDEIPIKLDTNFKMKNWVPWTRSKLGELSTLKLILS